MRVAHVHRIRGIGGSERHLLALLPALADRGVDVRFVGLDDPAGDPEPFYDELSSSGVPCTRLRSGRDLDPPLLRSLRCELRRLDPDVVHTHLVHADLYGALAVLGTRAALVSTKHNDDRFRAGPFRHVERLLARRASRVIAITESLRRFSVDEVGLPADRVEVVHYGLDELPHAWRENDPAPVPEGARVLLAVSRLAPQKGIDTAARALPAIRARHPDSVLVVLGEGPERPGLEKLAQDGLLLPGRVGDVRAWYERAELLVHPARWEGFGLALLEAMLTGRPVVASNVSSIPELVVDGETGLLVPPDDPEALAGAVNELLDDPERGQALGAAGRARALAEFSVTRMADRTLAVYATALSSPSEAR
jgi:glycosyltransferase involved in cell wall biosynthesis